MTSHPIHALRASEVYQALETSAGGLANAEAQSRLALYGTNTVREPPQQPLWRKFVAFITYPTALMLWAAGALALVSGRPFMGLLIWAVVLINAGFSFWREYRAGQAISTLKLLLPAYARVARGGVETQVLASLLVPGDVLVLGEGDNVPADARVVEEYGLRANDAILTGEATPARKSAAASLREGLTELEQPNLIFAGTSICAGTGRAVVHTTGMQTQFGRIANLTEQVKEQPSLLQQRLRRLTRGIAILAGVFGVVIFAIEVSDQKMPLVDALILSLGVVVAVVPEGLPATITLALAMAVQRLARKGVLVKKLAVVETLGTTSVICTDKSGTLTQNQMTVRELWVGGRRLSVSGVGYDPAGALTAGARAIPATAAADPDLRGLLTAAALCNNARLMPPSPDHPIWSFLGDQTEAALRVVALKGGLDEEALSREYPRLHELPFDARRKRMSTIHACDADEVAFVKGAPKEVLQLCTHIQAGGQVRPLDDATRAAIVAANDDYARNALRVLALARRELPARSGAYTVEGVERQLTFLGLAAMMDPPRPEVAEAVRICREAGIRWVMITGDYGLTAESVARRVGMLPPAGTAPTGAALPPRILTGADVDAMADAELQAALQDDVVCARMAPDHKLRLVSAFQARGDVVAVIGDGVNDAPALRKADVGIAMGITGTDVAKEAADVVLTDDNFGAIVPAIEEGRAIYDNLRKAMTYIFASNMPELVPFVLTALLNIPLALSVMQILAIDLGTDLLPAMALGMEKPESDVMRRPPVKREAALIDRRLLARATFMIGGIQTVLCYLAFYLVYRQAGIVDLALPRGEPALEQAAVLGEVALVATTVFHVGVVMAQIGNAFACRTERSQMRRLGLLSNRWLLGAIGISLALIVAMVYVPPVAAIFDHAPIPPVYWLGLATFAPIVFLFDWLRKAILRRKYHAGGAKV